MTFLYLFIRIANPFHSSLVGSIPRKKNPEMEIVGIKIIFYLYIYLLYHVNSYFSYISVFNTICDIANVTSEFFNFKLCF